MTRNVIITGASRGIGYAIAIGLARRGYDIALNDISAQASALDAVAAEIRDLGRRCAPITADVSDLADAQLLAREAESRLGQIHALVNNAGILKLGMIEDLAPEIWDQTFAVNARGVFLVTQAVMPLMRAHRYGRIVNIASLAARTGAPGQSHYAASKSAVAGFTRVSAMEFGPFGITVNSICPGIIMTEMGKNNLRDPDEIAFWKRATCLRRLGDPEDVVGPVAFFASDDSAFITGQALNVDGGIGFY